MKNFQNFQEFNIMQYFFIDQLGMFGYYVNTEDGSMNAVPQILYGPNLILGAFGSCMF